LDEEGAKGKLSTVAAKETRTVHGARLLRRDLCARFKIMCLLCTSCKMYQSRIRNAKQRSARPVKHRELAYPGDGQEYAIVTDMLGNGRVRVICDGERAVEPCIGRICGSMRKFKSKVIVERGDLVLVSRRDFEPSKVDVMHKYSHDEVSLLIYQNVLPEKLHKHITNPENAAEGDEYVMFADADDAPLDINHI